MRAKQRNKTPNHADLMEQKGLTIRDLMIQTGLSDEGVRKCIRDNRPPHNPLVRSAYLAALGLTEAAK
jgi:lambda repressor-like predicted transcriptional regulator